MRVHKPNPAGLRITRRRGFFSYWANFGRNVVGKTSLGERS